MTHQDTGGLADLRSLLAGIDIYLLDQLLRGRIGPGMRIVEAGCGHGRNLLYLLRAGFDVRAVDADAGSIAAVRRLAAEFASRLPPDNFRVEPVERMTFETASADVVISSAVLHFARDDDQFGAMLRDMWRVLKPGGLFFSRLASVIGMEDRMKRIAGRRYLLPDGSERYLVDEAMLLAWTRDLCGTLLDPLKTTVVQDQRCMTTWVLRKGT